MEHVKVRQSLTMVNLTIVLIAALLILLLVGAPRTQKKAGRPDPFRMPVGGVQAQIPESEKSMSAYLDALGAAGDSAISEGDQPSDRAAGRSSKVKR